MKDEEVYKYHGWREQCKHITSEMYELTEAIHDYEISTDQATVLRKWNDICEEVADVQFMLNQIVEHYLIQEDNLKAWGDFKRKREADRIRNGYYEKKK